MIKKLIFVLMASLLFLTGCQSIGNVDLNKMIMNGSKTTSSESKVTTSLELTYNKAKVQDKDLLKVLNLLNHAKLEIQVNVKDINTASLSGNVILQKGKIPFQMYVDQKEMVLLLDHAKKPIRIPVTEGDSTDFQLGQEIQTKLLESIVKNLPNPKNINVGLKTEKVNGTDVSGYNVNVKIYANEVPQLLNTFIDNLLNDSTSVSQLVSVINEVSGETITTKEFKNGLKEFKTELNQMVPELQKMKLLSNKNYYKTDIFVDNEFIERKSTSELNLGSIPSDIGLGVSGIRMVTTSETWNINGPVNVEKIPYSSYLNENATADQFLATLDKRNSVLYSVIDSFQPSKALTKSQVKIKNNKNKADTVSVKGIAKGDIIKVYKASTGKALWTTKKATGSTTSMAIKQLGKKGGKVYISVIHPNKDESSRLKVAFAKE